MNFLKPFISKKTATLLAGLTCTSGSSWTVASQHISCSRSCISSCCHGGQAKPINMSNYSATETTLSTLSTKSYWHMALSISLNVLESSLVKAEGLKVLSFAWRKRLSTFHTGVIAPGSHVHKANTGWCSLMTLATSRCEESARPEPPIKAAMSTGASQLQHKWQTDKSCQ